MKKLLEGFRSLLLGVVLALALSGCGGGGGGSSAPPVDPGPPIVVPPRTDLMYGYYGDYDNQVAETSAHVNMILIYGWTKDQWADGMVAHLAEAHAANIPNIVLALPSAYQFLDGEASVRRILNTLKAQGLLRNIVALYPIDEPETKSYTDARVTEVNAMLRKVMLSYPELAKTKLAVIYTRDGKWPGIASYDWVGFDDYDAGARVLGNATWDDMKSRLRPDQGIWLVPGGADPWRQDPDPFYEKAQADPQVVAIVPFIWFDNADRGVGLGVRSNGMKKAYCEVGMKVRNPGVPSPVCAV